VHGTPREVARFLSALPRILERTETRASEMDLMRAEGHHHRMPCGKFRKQAKEALNRAGADGSAA